MGSLIDIHIHTDTYSPCSSLSPEKIVLRARELELDGVVFTEHDRYWTEKKINCLRKKTGTKLLLLRGIEVSSSAGHILVYGSQKDFDSPEPKNIIRAARAAGGIAVKAHPFRYEYGPRTPIETLKKELGKFPALEAYNGNQNKKANRFGKKFCRRMDMDITAVGGSDAHSPDRVGKYATKFDETVKNEKDFLQLMRKGKCRPVKLF